MTAATQSRTIDETTNLGTALLIAESDDGDRPHRERLLCSENRKAEGMDSPTGSCDHRDGAFQYRLIHNGFNDSAYACCNQCSFTVLLCGWHLAAQRVKLEIHERITTDIEGLLKPCPCGAVFRASADPKCPHCARPLSAAKATIFIQRNAPWRSEGMALAAIVVGSLLHHPEREACQRLVGRRGP